MVGPPFSACFKAASMLLLEEAGPGVGVTVAEAFEAFDALPLANLRVAVTW